MERNDKKHGAPKRHEGLRYDTTMRRNASERKTTKGGHRPDGGRPKAPKAAAELPDDVLVGRNAVTEALKSGRGINKILLAQGDRAHDIEELLALAKERGVLTQTVERAQI